MSKVGVLEHEENDITPSDTKAAQIAGELLWLSVRSRLDIFFSRSNWSPSQSSPQKRLFKLDEGSWNICLPPPNRGLVYGPCAKNRGLGGFFQLTSAFDWGILRHKLRPPNRRISKQLHAGCPLQSENRVNPLRACPQRNQSSSAKPRPPQAVEHSPLRLRSTCFKKQLNDPNSGWMIRHLIFVVAVPVAFRRVALTFGRLHHFSLTQASKAEIGANAR